MFQKGRQKTGGRVAGTKNKETERKQSLLHDFFYANWDDFKTNTWPMLGPREQADFMKSILPFLFPKMSSVEVNDKREIAQTAREALTKAVNDASII